MYLRTLLSTPNGAWKKFRPRRNRRSPEIRELLAETTLKPSDFIYPCFVCEEGLEKTIEGLAARYRIDGILSLAESLLEHGIRGLALFPVIDPNKKDLLGSEALNEKGLIPETIATIKKRYPEIVLFADLALDPYTSHGHDGVINEAYEILNDQTIEILSQKALLYASCGVDFVAPSDMMDGRIEVIRGVLEENGFINTGILSYCVKYASSLYAPFRSAIGAPKLVGDKKGYQMDFRNQKEALLESLFDENEGADILMVKPAGFYLDILTKIKERTLRPLAAFQVSGEYAMIQAAGKAGVIDREAVLLESLYAIKRAGADLIFSYGALEVASLL